MQYRNSSSNRKRKMRTKLVSQSSGRDRETDREGRYNDKDGKEVRRRKRREEFRLTIDELAVPSAGDGDGGPRCGDVVH